MGHAKVKNGRRLNKCTLKRVKLEPGMSMAKFAKAEGHCNHMPLNPPIQDSQLKAELLSQRTLEIIGKNPESVKRIRTMTNVTTPVIRRALDTLRSYNLAHTVSGKRGVLLWVGGPSPQE